MLPFLLPFIVDRRSTTANRRFIAAFKPMVMDKACGSKVGENDVTIIWRLLTSSSAAMAARILRVVCIDNNIRSIYDMWNVSWPCVVVRRARK